MGRGQPPLHCVRETHRMAETMARSAASADGVARPDRGTPAPSLDRLPTRMQGSAVLTTEAHDERVGRDAASAA